MGSIQGDDCQLNGDLACQNAEIRGELRIGGVPIIPDAAPWPPFPPPATSGTLVQTRIYVRTTGSDATGNGSAAQPFRTFAHAWTQLPRQIPAGRGFVLDLDNLGVENLPQDWTAQPIIAENGGWIGPAAASPWIPRMAPIVVTAQPQLALPGTAGIVTIADAPMVTSVGGAADLVKVTIGGAPRPSWAAGALKGRMVYKTRSPWTGITSGNAPVGMVFDSNGNELFIANTPARFNNPVGVGALVLDPGQSLRIVEPSTTLQAPPSQKGNAIDFTGVLAGMAFQGIRLQCSVPGAANGGPAWSNQLVPMFEFCHLDGADFFNSGAIQIGLFTCRITDYINQWNAQITPRWSLLELGVGTGYGGNWLGVGSAFRQCVFDGCVPLGSTGGFVGSVNQSNMEMLNVWVRNPQADGIAITSPTRVNAARVQVDGSPGNAISVTGPCQVSLSDVTGSGNVGQGVKTDDGAHVQVDAGVTIGNADGRAYTNGLNAPVALWPGVAFNDADAPTFSRVFQP